MNTQFRYLYRDASNYKNFGEVIFRGQPSLELIAKLKASLKEGENFIASQIGIPEVFLWNTKLDYDPENLKTYPPNLGKEGYALSQDDHCWHELFEVKATESEPTDSENRSFEEFVKDVENASQVGWVIFDPQTLKA